MFLGVSCEPRETNSSFYGLFSEAALKVSFKRLQTFFVINLVIPNALILFLSALIFFIPGEIGEKKGFGITVTLALCVNLTVFTEFIPMSSKSFPRLFSYLLSSIVLSCLSMVIGTISVNVMVDDSHEDVVEGKDGSNCDARRYSSRGFSSVVGNNSDEQENTGSRQSDHHHASTEKEHKKSDKEIFSSLTDIWGKTKKRMSRRQVEKLIGGVYLCFIVLYTIIFFVSM